jgi:hypothetical protein
VTAGLLRSALETVRRCGIAEEHERSAAGIACVAAPLLGTDGHGVAALSITGWSGGDGVGGPPGGLKASRALPRPVQWAGIRLPRRDGMSGLLPLTVSFWT